MSADRSWWQDPARIASEIQRCKTFAAIGSVVTAAMPTILSALRSHNEGAAAMRDPFIPTPEMIAAAWGVLRDRWPNQPHLLGPGPGFREAIQAAFAEMPAPPARNTPEGGEA